MYKGYEGNYPYFDSTFLNTSPGLLGGQPHSTQELY